MFLSFFFNLLSVFKCAFSPLSDRRVPSFFSPCREIISSTWCVVNLVQKLQSVPFRLRATPQGVFVFSAVRSLPPVAVASTAPLFFCSAIQSFTLIIFISLLSSFWCCLRFRLRCVLGQRFSCFPLCHNSLSGGVPTFYCELCYLRRKPFPRPAATLARIAFSPWGNSIHHVRRKLFAGCLGKPDS